MRPDHNIPCPNGDWSGWGRIIIGPIFAALHAGAGGGYGGGSTGAAATDAGINPGGKPPLSGESLGIPNTVHIHIPSLLQMLGLAPNDPACDFVACSTIGDGLVSNVMGNGSPSSPFLIVVTVWAGTHPCGDFWCDWRGHQIGILEPAGRGIDPTNIEFYIVGAVLRPPTIWAGRYRSGGGGFNIKNFPFKGNRLGIDYHAWGKTAGKKLLHLDAQIQQLGIRLKHWPW